jgi:hypothetical protein
VDFIASTDCSFFSGKKNSETTILLKITAALRIFLSPVIRTSNFRRDGGVVLLIISNCGVSLSIFTTFLLGILLEKSIILLEKIDYFA